MDCRGHEIMTKSVHLQEGGETSSVSIVVSIVPLGEGGAGERFDGDDSEIRFFSSDHVVNEGKRSSSKIAPTADTAADDIWIFSKNFKLFFEFQSDHGLM